MFGRFRKTNDPGRENDGGAVAVSQREREIEHEREEPRPRHVPEKAVAEAPTLARPGDKTGDVRHHELPAVCLLVHDPELGREGGERIVSHPRTGGAERAE